VNLIGIDLGVHKIAMALFINNELADAISWEAPYNIPRDRQLRELAGVAYDWGLGHDADQIWVEEPLMGNNHKYSLAISELKGAVLSHLNVLRSRGCDIRTVNVSSWKREVVGKGNATKEQVSNYIDATHPDYAPFCDGDQDRIDACCVGLYGLRISARADGLRLAEPSQ
jgi:Holliday junction resolvasome RuvABC endonuclease subunit